MSQSLALVTVTHADGTVITVRLPRFTAWSFARRMSSAGGRPCWSFCSGKLTRYVSDETYVSVVH